MSQVLRAYIQEVERARKGLQKNQGKQLQSQNRRNNLRAIVEKYFTEVRPSLVSAREQHGVIKNIDEDMQTLLSICHQRASVKCYQEILENIKSNLIIIDTHEIKSRGAAANREVNVADLGIITTLKAIVPAASLSYEQAISDLEGAGRLSWRGPATDLREALRETLDYLAPDADVKASVGYRQNPETSGPTMKQKVQFILKSRGKSKSVSEPAENAVDAVEGALGSFVRSVYTRSTVSTHTPTDKTEVIRIRELVRVVLCELLEVNPGS